MFRLAIMRRIADLTRRNTARRIGAQGLEAAENAKSLGHAEEEA
jgi:hypothetical protein